MSESVQGRVITSHEDAEAIAIAVFEYIAAEIGRTVQFLRVTGLEPNTIRESAGSAHFLLGVLDYASKDEELLGKIEEEIGIRPAAILVAAVHMAPQPASTPLEVRSGVREAELPRRSLFH